MCLGSPSLSLAGARAEAFFRNLTEPRYASPLQLSNVAYEARDQALAEMAAIRAQGDGEQTAFEIEMARLNARLGARSRTRDAAMRELLYSSVQSISHLKVQAGGVTSERR